MTIRPITRWGTPVLHRAAAPVEAFDASLAELVADMFATMDAADGAGLAAPQVGVGLAVFVYDCTDGSGTAHRGVVCNPRLVPPDPSTTTLVKDDEGCLSLPGAYATCARWEWAACEGVDEAGRPVRVEGDGVLGRCLQHETDHLRGRVFGDLLTPRARRGLQREHERVAHEYPPDWPATAATE